MLYSDDVQFYIVHDVHSSMAYLCASSTLEVGYGCIYEMPANS